MGSEQRKTGNSKAELGVMFNKSYHYLVPLSSCPPEVIRGNDLVVDTYARLFLQDYIITDLTVQVTDAVLFTKQLQEANADEGRYQVIEFDNADALFIFDIDIRWHDDLFRFYHGEYSKFSYDAKKRITKYSGKYIGNPSKKVVSRVYAALYPIEEYKAILAKRYNVDKEYFSELDSIPDMEAETLVIDDPRYVRFEEDVEPDDPFNLD